VPNSGDAAEGSPDHLREVRNHDSIFRVPYRRTVRVERKAQQTRDRIERAAEQLVADGGYQAASVSAVAAHAGVGVGTVYRQFGSKSELLAAVFRSAASREVSAVEAALHGEDDALHQLEMAVATFTRRALASRWLAWALLAEPVDPTVEAERLAFRRTYRDLFARVISQGIERGELPEQAPAICAAALVGAIAEALVGPLAPTSGQLDEEHLVATLVVFCRRAVNDRETCHVDS